MRRVAGGKAEENKMYDKIAALSKKILSEKSLVGGRLNPEALQKAWQEGRAVFIQDEELKEIVACGILWFRKNSVELGSIWVDPKHRKQGRGKDVFSSLVDLAPKNIRLFVVAYDQSVACLALKHGMLEADRKDWMSAAQCPDCSLCDRLPEADRSRCSLKFFKEGYRVFFVLPQGVTLCRSVKASPVVRREALQG
jgi:GNAT superfamily N-acetyltransferase